jgi:translation initiation factor IF-3
VRLIDEKGNQLGVVSTREALALAKERGFDLVEVAPEARPPVCKILDYGKLKYEKKKKEQEAKKKAVTIDVKEIQLRPNIEDHDFMVKFRKLEEFLRRGDKVKIVVMFRGREMAYAKKQGTEMLNNLINLAKDFSAPEAFPKLEGRRMIMVLGPTKGKSSQPKKPEGKPEVAAKSKPDVAKKG